MADDDVRGQLLGGCVLAIDKREELVVHQITAHDGHQIGVVLVHWVQQLHCVIDEAVQCFVVGISMAPAEAGHDALGGVFADVLQPAFGDILQQGVLCNVCVGGGTGAVEADHDAVEGAAFDDGAAEAGLKVFEFGPGIELCVADVRVVIDLHAFVAFFAQGGGVYGFAGAAAAGVSAAGDGAGDAEADFFALQFVHADDVDFAEKDAGFLQFGFKLLLHAGLHVELRGCAGDGVEFGLRFQVAGVLLAGVVAHGDGVLF